MALFAMFLGPLQCVVSYAGIQSLLIQAAGILLIFPQRAAAAGRSAGLVWMSVVSDSLLAASYGLLLSCMVWMTMRLARLKGIRANFWAVFSFEMLILSCGLSRVVGVIAVWWPVYPVVASVKMVCALAAVPAALLFALGTPSLVHKIHAFVDAATDTEWQRDQAINALSDWERVVEERQSAAREIASAYAQLSAALEYTSDMVMTIGRDWTLLYGNRRLTESIPDFKLGRSYWACFPDAVGTITERSLRQAMGERVALRYENFYEPYGRWFKVNVYPNDDGLSVFFSDVTEEHKIREQLELEQMLREKRIEALSHMAGGLAHEISNPLAIIHARASDLKSAAMEADVARVEVVQASSSIVGTAERAMGILRGLRGFARNAENDPMEWAEMGAIIEQSVEIQSSRFERHGIELEVRIEQNLPLLLCREVQIGQIVTNLLNNAFDAIEQAQSADRWVELDVAVRGNQLCIEVTDSGPGVEEQYRAHLMEPFFTTKKAGQGMGVGLSLSQAIAQDHGGSLVLVAGTPHTCFRLLLPAGERQVSEAREEYVATHAAE